jgi:membrane protease YdiL (CAAX protease family)
VAYVAAMIGLLIGIIALIQAFDGSPAEMFVRPDSEPRITRFVGLVLVGPILEEFAFQGRIQGAVQARYGPAIGIGVGAVLFGLAHGLFGIGAMAMGVLFGLGMNATGSVWAAVALHGIGNLRAAVLEVWGLEAFPNWIASTWVICGAVGFLVLGLTFLVYFGRQLHVTIGWGAHPPRSGPTPTES